MISSFNGAIEYRGILIAVGLHLLGSKGGESSKGNLPKKTA
jgi:hypothetical protein